MSYSDVIDNLVCWEIPSTLPHDVLSLADKLKIPYQIVQILWQRGIRTEQDIKDFLNPVQAKEYSPWDLKDLDKGVERIKKALVSQEKIVVYGDYDVDGQTGTALLVSALRDLGADISYYIPLRLEEGYGLSGEGITQLSGRNSLLITVDCGITSVDEIKLAKSLGMDCIITDHHEPGVCLPNDACAIINPKRKDCPYPFKELAGCAVAFKLVQGLYVSLGKDPLEAEKWLDLVSLGTIVDVMPLVDENRRFVSRGLPMIHQRLGLCCLMEISGIKGQTPSAGQIGFILGPRLNAAGRLADASVGVELLLTDSKEKAKKLAYELNAENEKRQHIEEQILNEASRWIEENVDLTAQRGLVVSGQGWHPGVIGIVASRLANKYHRPTVCLSEDDEQIIGSARSIPDFDLYRSLAELKDLFTRFGGHKMAAGLSLEKENKDRFIRDFIRICNEKLLLVDLIPQKRADCLLNVGDVDLTLAREIARLGPFGQGNPEPIFAVLNATLIESKTVGQTKDHWSFKLQEGNSQLALDGIGFGMGSLVSKYKVNEKVDVLGSISAELWQGMTHLQLRLIDIRPALPFEVTTSIWQANSAIGQIAAGMDAEEKKTESKADCPRIRLHIHKTDDTLLSGIRPVFLWVKGQLVLLSKSSPPTKEVDLLVWDWPANLVSLREMVRKVQKLTEEVDVHLLAGLKALQRANEAMEGEYPSIDVLRRLYTVLKKESATKRYLQVARIRTLINQNGSFVTYSGICYGLEILSQLKLIEYQTSENGFIQVHFLPSTGEKVDLKWAVRYNEGEALKSGFIEFIRQINDPDGIKSIRSFLNEPF
jgi:single-stranded-DNA-specific exonuclease RecJ